jgi:spermidine/putrescine transport system substrate-binding protein
VDRRRGSGTRHEGRRRRTGLSDSKWPIWEKKYDRRGFVAVSAMTALLAACGGSTTQEEGQEETTTGGETQAAGGRPTPTGTFFYYNWADYVNPDTYKRFQNEFGVRVKKDFYASNEDLLAKLQGGARGYDLVVPTGYMVQVMGEEGLLEELDKSKVPLFETNVDDKFKGLPYDPDDRWSVPKDWGTTGYTYRTDLVKERPTTWKEFFELAKTKYSGKVVLLDGIPEVTGSTAVMLGYSYNTEDEQELDEVRKELLDLKPHILAITSTEVRQLLTSGRAVIGMTWNGDGAVVASEKPAEYVVAEEGGEFWIDAYAIPVGNKNTDAAYAWIDYTYEPEINSLETAYHNYGSVVKRELLEGVMDEKLLKNEDIFPAPEVIEKLEANSIGPEGVKIRDRIWTEFKAA